ncbi:MAG: SPOR domain-containing protein [Thiotrichales bacterium]
MPSSCPKPSLFALVFLVLVIPLLSACGLTEPVFRETYRSDSSIYLANANTTGFQSSTANPIAAASGEKSESITVVPASAELGTITDPNTRIYIQLAAFDNEANARKYRDELAKKQSQPVVVYRDDTADQAQFKVQLGPYATLNAAASGERKLRQQLDIDKVRYVRR